ncbi:MAG: YitT family protein [Porcipelethomonas sp.]
MRNTTEKKTVEEMIKRYILFIISLFISALGVAITKRGELGVSPISSVANVLSIKFTALSLGNWLIIWNCVLIVGQIIILKRKFQWIQLLQIPLSFLFGYFTDFGMWIVSYIKIESYPVRLIMIISGTIVLGFGISLSVIANVIMNSGEAFVKAVSDTISKDFGSVKIFFDISCVLLSIILSIVFFSFSIKGIREGTVIAAFCTGWTVKFFRKFLEKPLCNLIT